MSEFLCEHLSERFCKYRLEIHDPIPKAARLVDGYTWLGVMSKDPTIECVYCFATFSPEAQEDCYRDLKMNKLDDD